MGIGIIGIPSAGVSNLSIQEQLISQLDANQLQMDQLETEISSGYQFQLPSQNPQAALQVEGIQSMLERYVQTQTNIGAAQSSLSQTDSTLSSVSSLLTSIQSAALSVTGSTTSAAQRQAVIQQIDQAVQQMVSLGNTTFNGQQLFGGTNTTTPPFSMNAAGNVVYSGSSEPTESYVDVNQLFATSITGDQAFGAMSQPIQGAALSPAISPHTPLADLDGGQGFTPGSIAISDGHSTSVVNLGGAQTLGDVATLIEQHPPAGRTVDVDVTPTGLTLQLEPDSAYPTGDNLSVQEVGSGTTASDLGILNAKGVGAGLLVGKPLDAAVTPTTSLDDLFGTQAQANIHFGQPNSDIVLQANAPGATTGAPGTPGGGVLLNGVTVQFVADAPTAGQEMAVYNPGTPASTNAPGTPGTLTVHISNSATSGSTAGQIVAAINKVAGLPFTASLDPSDQNGGGQPPITALPATTTTAGGGGAALDPAGLQITSAGKIYTVALGGDKTVQDLLNGISGCGAGLDAQINAAQTGINVSSRVSGADFSIGENGGTTATQFGIRTFTAATPLSQLNHGAGVGVNTVTPGGTDFTISETINDATVKVPVSIAGDSTVGDVLQSINAAINTAAQTAGVTATVHAQLATSGNGIELTDSSAGSITVTADSQSTAAVDLGLIPEGQTSATSTPVAATASGTEASVGNNELLFQSDDPAYTGNVKVIFNTVPGLIAGNETVNYDQAAHTLTFNISSQTTAKQIIAAMGTNNGDPVSAPFTASLDYSHDSGNTGSGIVQPQAVEITGGTAAFGANNGLYFVAENPGAAGNVQVVLQTVAGITAGHETVNYDSGQNTLTFNISPQTTANDIITTLQANRGDPVSAPFTAFLDLSTDTNNNGNGVVPPQTIQMSGGTDPTGGGSGTNAWGWETAPSNSELLFQAVNPAITGNVQVVFQSNPSITAGHETVNYDSAAHTLTFQVSPQTTANDIITALEGNPAANAAVTAALNTTTDPTNTGYGFVQPQAVETTGGTAAFGANSELLFKAVNPGTAGNAQVVFTLAAPPINAGAETAQYDPTTNTLTFNISQQSTANDIIAALQANPAANAAFTASLDTSNDPNNNGNGVVLPQSIQMSGGQEVLTGSDTNPQQTDSIFTALIRLGTALQNNDSGAVQQAMGLLSNSMQNLGNTREQLGVQEQSLSTLTTQITNEQTNLKSAMSTNYDTDMTSAVSDYTSAQIAYQATLEVTASMLKMTLLNYL